MKYSRPSIGGTFLSRFSEEHLKIGICRSLKGLSVFHPGNTRRKYTLFYPEEETKRYHKGMFIYSHYLCSGIEQNGHQMPPFKSLSQSFSPDMYYREHSPAHFHAEYGDYTITIEIESGVVEGKFPRRVLSAVIDW